MRYQDDDRASSATLSAAMRRLASETAGISAPRELESVLLREFDRTTRVRHIRLSFGILAAGAAAAVLAIWMVHYRPTPRADAAPVMAVETQPFVPIPYVQPLAPYERIEVVRMELPVAALIAAGLPMSTADPGAQAEADVLLGQDGRARAVRLISISNIN